MIYHATPLPSRTRDSRKAVAGGAISADQRACAKKKFSRGNEGGGVKPFIIGCFLICKPIFRVPHDDRVYLSQVWDSVQS